MNFLMNNHMKQVDFHEEEATATTDKWKAAQEAYEDQHPIVDRFSELR